MRKSLASRLVMSLAVITTSGLTVCEAQEHHASKTKPRFIRLRHDVNDEPAQMQTSIVRYRSASGDAGLTVDLIGAVHIGEADYYAKLNRRFKQYDVVLYELVAPEGVRPDAKRQSDNPLSIMHGMARSVLNLDSQLEHIDYSAENFVHADMTPQEISDSMKARGENGLSIALSVMADVIRESNKQGQKMQEQGSVTDDVPDPLAMLFAADRDVQLKRMMAEQFASMGTSNMGLGPTLNRMLIADRNDAAMRVLKQEVAKGHKKIAIFYGAAHMPDFARRLTEDFGLSPTKTTWLTAWDLKSDGRQPRQGDPLSEVFKLLP